MEPEWKETFARLDRGESSYRDEARRLGVNPATVLRHYLKNLESRTEVRRKELTDLEERNQELAREYEKKRREEEAKIRSVLNPLKAEYERTKAGIEELTREISKRGLSLEEALDCVKKTSDLRREAGELHPKVGTMREELNRLSEGRMREESRLRSLKNQHAFLRLKVSALRNELSWLSSLQLAVEKGKLAMPCKSCGRWEVYADMASAERILRFNAYWGYHFRCVFCSRWSWYPSWELAWYVAQLVLPTVLGLEKGVEKMEKGANELKQDRDEKLARR